MCAAASRVTTRIQITTGGHGAYAEAVEGAFGMDVDYAMLINLYAHLWILPKPATALLAAFLEELVGLLEHKAHGAAA